MVAERCVQKPSVQYAESRLSTTVSGQIRLRPRLEPQLWCSGRLMPAYLLLLPRNRKPKYKSDGSEAREWFLTLPRGSDGYPWGPLGEDGPQGRSVKCTSKRS